MGEENKKACECIGHTLPEAVHPGECCDQPCPMPPPRCACICHQGKTIGHVSSTCCDNPYELYEQPKEARAKVGLYVDSRYLQLMPKEGWGTMCSNCLKPQAKWGLIDWEGHAREAEAFNARKAKIDAARGVGTEVAAEPPGPRVLTICSVCFLHDSLWAQREGRKEELSETIAEIANQLTARSCDLAMKRGATAEEIQAIRIEIATDDNGRILDPSHADNVLGKLFLLSRAKDVEVHRAQANAAAAPMIIGLNQAQFRMKS